ncbi:MAG: hypothetical protein LPK85_12850 [Gammaproteobacteria bacterium]|nr:hypothetical protein [Gammaproteobacteria bacterium]
MHGNGLVCVEDVADVFCDGAVSDHGNLVFVSLWGRDTALQELLARLTLGPHQGGLDALRLASGVTLFVPDEGRVEKASVRHKSSTFGGVVNLWLYTPLAGRPDRVNHRAYLLVPVQVSASMVRMRLWALVRDVCPLPLLDGWSEAVMTVLEQSGQLTVVSSGVGPVVAWRLHLDVPVLEQFIGEQIRAGVFGLGRGRH